MNVRTIKFNALKFEHKLIIGPICLQKKERIQAMAAREKAMNTWPKGKEVKDQVSDDEESGKDEEISKASKVRRKKRRTSEALQFL